LKKVIPKHKGNYLGIGYTYICIFLTYTLKSEYSKQGSDVLPRDEQVPIHYLWL